MSGDPSPPIAIKGVPFGIRPRLKIFLSADIIGSTAYKQPLDVRIEDASRSEDWARIINGFYGEAQDLLQQNWDQLSIAEAAPDIGMVGKGPRPVFWKTVGDEVIFWKELTGDVQIWLLLSCWLKTISGLRNYLRIDNETSLDVKSTIWLAGFPIRNKAVPVLRSSTTVAAPLPNEALTQYYEALAHGDQSVVGDVDFIGPGIDVGFRLGQFASSKKMAVSLDCAYLLALTYKVAIAFQDNYDRTDRKERRFFPDDVGLEGHRFETKLQVYFSGNEPLKGVLGGIHYPKFWISTMRHGSLDAAKDVFYAHGRKPLDWDKLETYCARFYQDRAQFIAEPFINARDSLTIARMPPTFPGIFERFVATSA